VPILVKKRHFWQLLAEDVPQPTALFIAVTPAIIIRPVEVIDMTNITKVAVLGGGNFRCQGD
jgi:hypothetical protein